MLAVSPLRNTTTSAKDVTQGQMEEGFDAIGSSNVDDDFADFSDGNLLESIDFDDLFLGIDDGDVLPDLEMDPEILAEFSLSSSGEEESEINASVSTGKVGVEEDNKPRKEEEDKVSGSGSGLESSLSNKGEEIVSNRDESVVVNHHNPVHNCEEGEKGRKPASAQAKNKDNQGKRKVKVDWTPELHRRFVQAVEQLGVDKAVPSRILEIMGIDCLTRHNIASHLQKYRSHRKHLLAREAEAASWSQRRQMYGAPAAAVGGGGGAGKRDNIILWYAPTMGFPPITPVHPHFRPLHVWGHPSMDQSLMHMWPKHLVHHSPSPPPPPHPTWPPPPPTDPSYWRHHSPRVPNGLTPGTPCFPQPLPPAPPRFATPPVPGIPPPHAMYKVDPGISVPTGHSVPHPPFELHPSKESIDAAIGDVLAKPWLPLPLGLKPPSMDGVMVELQRQGVPNIPPTCA